MPKNYAELPPNEVRRSDRAVNDDAWIQGFLHRAPMCTVATSHEGQPFINSNLFVYDAQHHCIYTHTARVGRTQANVTHNAKVCLSIMEMGRLLPAEQALEFSVEYAGVVVFGEASLVEDPEQAKAALQLIMDKYAPHLTPGSDYRPPVDEELPRTSVFRIDISSWSGKKKSVPEDFPGAYLYEDVYEGGDEPVI